MAVLITVAGWILGLPLVELGQKSRRPLKRVTTTERSEEEAEDDEEGFGNRANGGMNQTGILDEDGPGPVLRNIVGSLNILV
jgi:hypothetical protein